MSATNNKLAEALEIARNGLRWYQDRYPDEVNGCDDEAMAKIDVALAAHAAESAQAQPSDDSLVADLHAAGFETVELLDFGDDTRQTWTCRIGTRAGVHVPPGGDAPMRDAVQSAFMALTGECAEACFSGWGDKFTESELAVIENRAPNATRGSVGEARLHALEQALQDSVGKIFSGAALTAIYRHCDELLGAANLREAEG